MKNDKRLSLVNRSPILIDIELGVCNLDSRKAMGLPEHYVIGDLERDLSFYYTELLKLDHKELIDLIENISTSFLYRFIAGHILGLIGDSRISSNNPTMIEINSWSGYLGLHIDEVDDIVNEFKQYGVLRNWIEKESPEYFVEIKPFKIAKYLVTNKEYLAFLQETNYSEIPTSWDFGQYPHQLSNHPVYTLSDKACIEYTIWLSKQTGRKFRLPSEAEWEYVAGGPDRLEYPWGNEFLLDCANTLESGIFQSTPIGIFPKGNSSFGCCDMAGNVEEYVLDYYNGYSNTKMVIDDLVEINGKYRVARGGSFTRYRDLTRCKRRHGWNPNKIYVMGFRLAEDY